MTLAKLIRISNWMLVCGAEIQLRSNSPNNCPSPSPADCIFNGSLFYFYYSYVYERSFTLIWIQAYCLIIQIGSVSTWLRWICKPIPGNDAWTHPRWDTSLLQSTWKYPKFNFSKYCMFLLHATELLGSWFWLATRRCIFHNSSSIIELF